MSQFSPKRRTVCAMCAKRTIICVSRQFPSLLSPDGEPFRRKGGMVAHTVRHYTVG